MLLVDARSATSLFTLLVAPLFATATMATMAAASGCNAAPDERGPSRPIASEDPASIVVPPDRPTSPVTRDEVLEPRRGTARFDAADYAATHATFRLYGVELGDGTQPKRAVLADTFDWSTRSYDEDALLGRGMRIAAITERGVVLRAANGNETTLVVGADVSVRVVRHRHDRVVRPLGKHRFAFDGAAARAVRDEGGAAALPTTEAVEIFGARALRLGPVADGSLLAESGFREGDLLLPADDATAEPLAPSAIAAALTDGRRALSVRLVRNGVVLTRVFVDGAVTGTPSQ